jgi:threonyl-tRNA synthetase
VQACVLSITEQHGDYAKAVTQALRQTGIRAVSDGRNEKIGYKIREQTLLRVPYLVVVGADEVANGTVTLRDHAGENLGTMALADATLLLKDLSQLAA